MPEGPLGFPRLTSIGPFVTDDVTLYHFTDNELVDSILDNGFEVGTEAVEEELRDRDKQLLLGEIKSNQALERALDEARPDTVPEYIPRRLGSNFFFENEDIVREKLSRVEDQSVIVVDGTRLVPGGAVISYEYTSDINQLFYESHSVEQLADLSTEGASDIDDSFRRAAEDWWNDVSQYRGKESGRVELWFNERIPPSMIKGVIE